MNNTGAEYDYTDIPPEDLWFGITFLLLCIGIVLCVLSIIINALIGVVESSNQVHPDPGFPIGLPMKEIILEPPNQDLRNSDVRSR